MGGRLGVGRAAALLEGSLRGHPRRRAHLLQGGAGSPRRARGGRRPRARPHRPRSSRL